MKRLLALLLLFLCGLAQAQFDHGYAGWDSLLKKHVKWLPDNSQSRVGYAAFKADRAALKTVLDAMSAVPPSQFDQWPREQRMAFLINAYPRVHAAVNCSSIGCPALRNEAFTAAKLEAQLEDGMRRFMADRTRNRVRNGRLEVSAIFKWYTADFEQGHQGFAKVEDVFARYATLLSDKPEARARLRDKTLPTDHLDYDWSLNARGR